MITNRATTIALTKQHYPQEVSIRILLTITKPNMNRYKAIKPQQQYQQLQQNNIKIIWF